MDLSDKDAKRGAEPGFEPLELNENNIRAIVNRCGKSNRDGSTEWTEENLKKNRANIRYLLGQLALVHERIQRYRTPGIMLAVRYDGTYWTEDITFQDVLLNLGEETGVFSRFKRGGKQFVKLDLNELRPTRPPRDPKFAAWWESADGLMVRAQAAKDEDKLDEAVSLCEKAAELGNADARYICCYPDWDEDWVDLEDLAPVDLAAEKAAAREALRRCEEAAEQGDAAAQLSCGLMYYEGEGTAKDFAKALYWFERAAQQGDVFAQINCGKLYLYGVGTAADEARALYWYEKAAGQGYAHALFRCGAMHYAGEGTAKDEAAARLYFQKAAAQSENKALQEMDWKKMVILGWF